MSSTSSPSPEPDSVVAGRTGAVRRLLIGAVALAVGLAACSSAEPRTLPPPSSTSSTEAQVTTSSIDLSRVPLDTVAGNTTTTLRQRGSSTVSGVVGGPEGNLAGAVVRIERLVGDAVQSMEVVTAEDGTWMREALPGGRYRIRAYLPPELTMVDPAIFYLRDGQSQELNLQVQRFAGAEVQAGTTPAQPIVGDAVNLALRVSRQVVDQAGVVRLEPLDNVPVRVRSTGWRPVSDDTRAVTDQAGQVLFTFECDRVTPVTATAIVGQDRQSFVLEVPPCAPVPTTTTQAPPEGESPPTTGA